MKHKSEIEGYNNGLLRDTKKLVKQAADSAESLSAQQREFCHAMLTAESAKAAAITAGYSPHTATSKASQLLAEPKIQEYLGLLGLLRSQAVAIDATEIISLQLRTYYVCMENGELAEANKALDQLAKMNGLYKPLMSGIANPRELKSMDKEEKKTEMAEMIDLVSKAENRKSIKLD